MTQQTRAGTLDATLGTGPRQTVQDDPATAWGWEVLTVQQELSHAVLALGTTWGIQCEETEPRDPVASLLGQEKKTHADLTAAQI